MTPPTLAAGRYRIGCAACGLTMWHPDARPAVRYCEQCTAERNRSEGKAARRAARHANRHARDYAAAAPSLWLT